MRSVKKLYRKIHHNPQTASQARRFSPDPESIVVLLRLPPKPAAPTVAEMTVWNPCCPGLGRHCPKALPTSPRPSATPLLFGEGPVTGVTLFFGGVVVMIKGDPIEFGGEKLRQQCELTVPRRHLSLSCGNWNYFTLRLYKPMK